MSDKLPSHDDKRACVASSYTPPSPSSYAADGSALSSNDMVQLPPPAAGFDDASAASTSAFADAAASASFAASAPAAQPRPSPPSSSGAGSGSGSVSVSAGSSAGVRVPAGARPGAPDSYYPFAYKVHEGGRVGELRGVVASLLGLGAGRIPRKLPGPLPHTMSRAAIPTIARGYWVCEKTDGLRTMLLAHPALGVFLIDRSFDFYQIDDDRGLFAAVLATRGPSLLDCELVRNVMGAPPGTELLAARQSGPFVLAVFDVVCLNGDDTAQLLLVDRLQRAGLARNAMNEALGRAQLASSDAKLPFVLTTKLFKPAYDMKSLQRMMVEFRVHGDKHYCFDNAEKGIKTLNDGLIFTPNDNNYAMTRTSLPIYKWKWPGMNTVDFLLRKPWFDNKGDLVMIMAASEPFGQRSHQIMARATTMLPAERERFLNEVNRADVSSVVAEFAFDPDAGSWKIKGYRWDKNESNFCHTVFSCMEASIGHVDLRELGDRLLQLKPEWKMADQEARAAFNNSTANNSNMR